jgi:uncharacterized protein YegJ (DUF2314 family)
MNFDFDEYALIGSGQHRMPSSFAMSLASWAKAPSAEEARQVLEEQGCTDFEITHDDEGWRLTCNLGELSVQPSENVTQWHVGPGQAGATTLEEMSKSNESLVLVCTLEDPVLDSFHRILRILHALAPEAVGLLDRAACRAHSAEWVRSVAESVAPPPPTSLFCLHGVNDGDQLWIHSHGLLRCGSIELEMLDVPSDDASDMGMLINIAAKLFLEEGTCPPGEIFHVGQDLELLWHPWQAVIPTDNDAALGGVDDRDDWHANPSGVLFAPKKKRMGLFGKTYQSATIYREILAGNPLLYHSTMETRRMSMLAKEHFAHLRALESRFRGQEGWSFSIKLGYAVDDDPEQSEHMWFEIHGIDRAGIDATLLNQPYDIARMNQGDRGVHPPDTISDWAIHCPYGTFSPDNVGELQQLLREE